MQSVRAADPLDLVAFNGAVASIVGFPNFPQRRWFERAITIHEIALVDQ